MILTIGPSLVRILQLTPPSELEALGQRLHVKIGSDGFLSSLFQALLDTERVSVIFEHLSHSARDFLTEVLLRGGAVSWQQAFRRPELRQTLEELAPTGLIFSIEDRNYVRHFSLPWEYDNFAWSRTAMATLDRPLASKETTPRKETAAADWCPFLQDIYQILSFARTDPIALTQQGAIYKRVESKLVQKLWPHLDLGQASQKLQQLVSFALQTQLLEYQDAGRSIVANETGIAEFFELTVAERYQTWFSYSYERGADTYLRQVLIATCAFLKPDQWLDLEQFMAWLAAYGVTSPTFRQTLERHISRLVTWGVWEGNQERGRLTDSAYYGVLEKFASTRSGQAVVEPTGEVLVPPDAPWSERWAWDKMTTLVRTDRMSVYQIDSHGLERSLDLGMELDHVVETLEAMTKSGIPANVRTNIDDWRRLLTRHRVIQATLIHSATPRDSQEVEHRLGKRVIFRLSETDLVIRPQAAQESIRLLNKAGILVRSQIERPGVERREDSDTDVPMWSPYFDDRYSEHFYPISANVASANMKVPNYEKIQKEIESAILLHSPIQVTHVIPGERREITQKIVPYQMHNGWLQGTVVGSHQMANIQVHRIQELIAGKSP